MAALELWTRSPKIELTDEQKAAVRSRSAYAAMSYGMLGSMVALPIGLALHAVGFPSLITESFLLFGAVAAGGGVLTRIGSAGINGLQRRRLSKSSLAEAESPRRPSMRSTLQNQLF